VYPGVAVVQPVYVGAPSAITSNPAADADALHHAMKGAGTDEDAIIRILAHRNPAEIEAIKLQYANKHGKDLAAAIKSETSGNFERVLIGLLRDPRSYDAHILHEAMRGAGTDERTLILFLAGREAYQLHQTKKEYEREHGKSLEAAVASETSGDFKKLLVGLCSNRDLEGPVNIELARGDAEKLYAAGEGKIGTDEAKFIEIFSHRSHVHLRQVFAIYETIHKHHTIERALESEFSGHIKQGLLAVASYVRSPGEFWADALVHTMKGIGTNDQQLVWIVVANRDRMPEIKQAFSAKYKKSLWQAVNSETSGDYKKSLLAIIGN